MTRIATDRIDRLRTDGYLVVEDFMTSDELTAVAANLTHYFPTAEEFGDNPSRWPDLDRTGDGVAELPFRGTALNHMSTHPDLIALARAYLGEDDVFLTQSICWAKYAGRDDFTQPLHLDWHDNSLVMPRSDGAFGQVHMIIYYSDVTGSLAPTTVVPHGAGAGRPLVPWARKPGLDPDLYRAERTIEVPAGALLCFTGRTFHRCSGFTTPVGGRFTHHLAWRGAGYEWMSWRGWARYADQLAMVRWLPKASVEQRTVLGFPPPGHPYWNEESVALVGARYPRMDMTPYRQPVPAA